MSNNKKYSMFLKIAAVSVSLLFALGCPDSDETQKAGGLQEERDTTPTPAHREAEKAEDSTETGTEDAESVEDGDKEDSDPGMEEGEGDQKTEGHETDKDESGKTEESSAVKESKKAQASADGDCDENTVRCNGSCVNISVSPANCGKCGRRCFNRQSCVEGNCRGLGVVTATELQERLGGEKDFLLVNVRVPADGIIPGTDASIPHDNIEKLKEFIGDDLDRPVVLYCGTTGRVQVSLRSLFEHGYRSVTYLDGGAMGWQTQGLPLEQ